MNTFQSYIKTSRPDLPNPSAAARQEWLAGRPKTICYGDKIFVRVTSGRTILMEETFDRVADMTELTGEVRSRLRGTSGLYKVWIRNCSRGWSTDRPLMFYRHARNAVPGHCSPSTLPGMAEGPRKRMLAPWETH